MYICIPISAHETCPYEVLAVEMCIVCSGKVDMFTSRLRDSQDSVLNALPV